MDYYIDAQVLPDSEFGVPLLMGTLFNKLHRSLVALKAENIGVSFPEYTLKPKRLGSILRLHGKEDALGQLLESGCFIGMTDHMAPVLLQPVPDTSGYLWVRRKQYQTNVERLRRRRMKRKGETYEEACRSIPNDPCVVVDRPYLMVGSQSTGQRFSLFVDQERTDQAVEGVFNCYGFSQHATVPFF